MGEAEAEQSSTSTTAVTSSEVDALLTAQLVIAWAGEGGEEPRLGWWRTDMVSEFGGQDLFRRLLPHTWEWAVLEAVREAARRHDAQMRARVHDPDSVVSLYRLGFALDERIDERLLDLKRSGVPPRKALPSLGSLLADGWSKETFLTWVHSQGEAKYETAPAGRQLVGSPPDSLEETAQRLVAALDPITDHYPLPHFRRRR